MSRGACSSSRQRVTIGAFLCCEHGIKHLLERGRGSVFDVAALLGAASSFVNATFVVDGGITGADVTPL